MSDARYRVAIVQRGISRHRVSFYERLRESLAGHGIELVVVHGHFSPWVQGKRDLATLSWGVVVKNHVLRFRGKELYWQPVLKSLKGVDLVIAEQANRLLVNYLLLLLRALGRFKFAFWGHGRNFQSNRPGGLLESLKNLYTRHVDWWFAYAAISAESVMATGMPAQRITVVQNAADTDVLREAVNRLTAQDLADARDALGIRSERIAVYCGGLYRGKRIDFLLDAASRVRERLPDFELLVIGGGTEAALVEARAREWPWLHYVGPFFGAERVPLMKLAKVQLIPGLVGLGIVDSFVLQLPLITTEGVHGPEISYLDNHVNGLMVADDPQAFADTVSRVLQDEKRLTALREGCRAAAARYTVENMVANFTDGVMACLEQGK